MTMNLKNGREIEKINDQKMGKVTPMKSLKLSECCPARLLFRVFFSAVFSLIVAPPWRFAVYDSLQTSVCAFVQAGASAALFFILILFVRRERNKKVRGTEY